MIQFENGFLQFYWVTFFREAPWCLWLPGSLTSQIQGLPGVSIIPQFSVGEIPETIMVVMRPDMGNGLNPLEGSRPHCSFMYSLTPIECLLCSRDLGLGQVVDRRSCCWSQLSKFFNVSIPVLCQHKVVCNCALWLKRYSYSSF